jgi:hypothetical protein
MIFYPRHDTEILLKLALNTNQSINDILFLLLDGDFKDILPDDLSELPPDEDLFSIIGPELTEDDGKY